MPARLRGEGGFTAAAYMVVVGLSLLPLVWFANIGVYLYGQGAVHDALDEGARAGARVGVDSTAVCQQRARATLGNVLGGTMGRGVTVTCDESNGVVRARATVHFGSFLPPVPDWNFAATAAVVKEQVS
ncbi:MAG: hypothetical protein M3066_02200 [Actinomycetota bacterium]|nr:hypothetical protein [Actinomycetota bacterium]